MVHDCICFCEHPLNTTTFGRLITLGVIMVSSSFAVTLRALKGLRHARWANLLSVLYPVPIEVFPVEWSRPREAGGGPIEHRSEGTPVQGEPAFDPFCLMDEQTESGRTRLGITPMKLEQNMSRTPSQPSVSI